MSKQKQSVRVELSGWCPGAGGGGDITFWPLNDGAPRYPGLHGRVSAMLHTGDATVNLRPTAAEARALIEALQWALDNPAQGDQP